MLRVRRLGSSRLVNECEGCDRHDCRERGCIAPVADDGIPSVYIDHGSHAQRRPLINKPSAELLRSIREVEGISIYDARRAWMRKEISGAIEKVENMEDVKEVLREMMEMIR